MPKVVVAMLLLAAVATPSLLFATQRQQGTEARVAAYKHEDGRIEFALQVREGSDWSERILPTGRFLRPTARTGRWIPSTPVTLIAAEVEEETLSAAEEEPESTSGQLGPAYEWSYPKGGGEETLTRHRVDWSTENSNGSKHIRLTVPDIDERGWPCGLGEHSCRYELLLWCGADPSLPGLIVLLQRFWMFGDRVWKVDDAELGWENRKPTTWRIATSVDHRDFDDSWLVYYPRGQAPSIAPNAVLGADFILEGDAAQAFLARAKQQSQLSITVNSESFTFHVAGAFDNPATRQLERCGE